jgi:hypothetical protein
LGHESERGGKDRILHTNLRKGLTKYISIMDDSQSVEEKRFNDPDSIIDRFLDIINVKKLLTVVINKTPLKTTNTFISGLILAIFLTWLYNELHVLQVTLDSWMIVLYILVLFLIVELLGKNVDSIKRLLFNEDNNRAFLKNITISRNVYDTQNEILLRKFSPSNIDFYLNIIETNPHAESGFVLEKLIIGTDLTINNLNKLFSPTIIPFIREEIAIELLLNYRNKLSKENLLNLYNYFRSNDLIIKYICATQSQCEFLRNENVELATLYKKIREERKDQFASINLEMSYRIRDYKKFSSASAMMAMVCQISTISAVGFWMQPTFVTKTGYINPTFSQTLIGLYCLSIILALFGGFGISSYFKKKDENVKTQFMNFVEQS